VQEYTYFELLWGLLVEQGARSFELCDFWSPFFEETKKRVPSAWLVPWYCIEKMARRQLFLFGAP
jgi:hypothetical protein